MTKNTLAAPRRVALWLGVALGLVGGIGAGYAADLSVRVTTAKGQPLPNAAITANWPGAPPASGADQSAEVTQRHLKFYPHILVVAKNTSVTFPNYDRTRHQVYSFSPAKTFNLKLYVGRPQRPLVFDKTGIVTLGCDIHDYMQAFIVVTANPRHAVTDQYGRAVLHNLPDKPIQLAIWHPWMPSDDIRIQRKVRAGTRAVDVTLGVEPPPSARHDSGPSLQDQFNQLAQ